MTELFENPATSGRNTAAGVALILVLCVLVPLTSQQNFVLFRCLAGLISIGVACAVAMIAWNTRHLRDNGYLLFLGLAYAGTAFIDMMQILSTEELAVLTGPAADMSVQLQVIARSLEMTALLIAPLFLGRRLSAGPTAAVIALTVASLVGLALHTDLLPTCSAPGEGHTPFMLGMGWVIVAGLLGAIGVIRHYATRMDKGVIDILAAAMVAAIASQLVVAMDHDLDWISATTAHTLKLISSIMVYAALIRLGLRQPMSLLFHDLSTNAATLEAAANHDPLTGLYSRRGLEAVGRARLALATRLDLPVTLVYADLNGLKRLNDTQGHAAGDQALRDAARVLADTLRKADVVARIGGDEFAALLVRSEPGPTVARVRLAVAQFNRSTGRPYELSMALGAACAVPDDRMTVDDLLRRADLEMYTDKQAFYAKHGATRSS